MSKDYRTSKLLLESRGNRPLYAKTTTLSSSLLRLRWNLVYWEANLHIYYLSKIQLFLYHCPLDLVHWSWPSCSKSTAHPLILKWPLSLHLCSNLGKPWDLKKPTCISITSKKFSSFCITVFLILSVNVDCCILLKNDVQINKKSPNFCWFGYCTDRFHNF